MHQAISCVDIQLNKKNVPVSVPLEETVEQLAAEIQKAVGSSVGVRINIKPEVKRKKLFSVCVNVLGRGRPLVVKKIGSDLIQTLKRVRRILLRRIHTVTHYKKQKIKQAGTRR